MTTVLSYPGIKHTGIHDKSARQPERLPDLVSQHTPLFMCLAQMGSDKLQVIQSNEFVSLYGDETLVPNSQYYTHQSEAIATAIAAGNSTIAIQRIIPDDALKASVSLGVESVLGENWFISNIKDARDSLTYTPVMEATINAAGQFGNQYRFDITKADRLTRYQLGISRDVQFYKFRLLKLNTSGTGMITIPNTFGSYETLFCLCPDTIGNTNVDYYLPERIKACYIDRDIGDYDDAILGSFRFYIENFTKLVKASSKYNPQLEIWNQDLDTIFGSDITLVGITNELFDFEFTGGSDGIENDTIDYITKRLNRIKVYDDKCRDFLLSLTNSNAFTDDAKYPYTTLYDTGFSFDTKLAMRTIMNTRRDVWIGLSCFTVADYFLGEDGEQFFNYVPEQNEQSLQGIASRLQAAFRLYPESYEFGTTAVRAIIHKNSGVINNSLYKKRRSIIIDTIHKVCKYMGAADGKFKQRWMFDGDDESLRLLSGWSNLDCTYQPPHIKTLSQQNGLTYVEAYDTSSFYVPYYQTIFDDNTSVLNDFVTMVICCNLERLGLQAYRKYAADNSLTPTKRAEKTSLFIEQKSKDQYHGRVTVTAKSLPPNVNSGDIVTRTIVSLYADKALTENTFIVETHRRGAAV